MSSTRAVLYCAVWLLLTAYYLALVRAPGAVPAAPRALLLPGWSAEQVVGLDVLSGGGRLRAARTGAVWQVVVPESAPVPGDLVAALAAALTDATSAESVALDTSRDRDFGLVDTARKIVLSRADGAAAAVLLGTRNPPQTAVYARREGAAETMLLGLNVEYYFDLLADHARGPAD